MYFGLGLCLVVLFCYLDICCFAVLLWGLVVTLFVRFWFCGLGVSLVCLFLLVCMLRVC